MHYPSIAQPTAIGTWPNPYPVSTQQQAIPTVYYQMPTTTVPIITKPEVLVSQQQIPTVYYQTPSLNFPSNPPTISSQVNIPQQQPQTTSTTTIKTTRTLHPTADSNTVAEETSTTSTVTKPEIPATQAFVTSASASVPQVTTSRRPPTVETTTTDERPQIRTRRLRTLSTSTCSDSSTTFSQSTITPQPQNILQPTVLPPQIPIQTANIAPMRRVIHHAHHPPRTPSGYYSSDLDYGKRRVYKTDYKYRHYYCCNWCKGRCDLRNRSYGCCEWFYGCPLWGLIFCGLVFLGLLVLFFTLFGLQPSINSARRSDTAQTVLLNRTEIIYGFYKLCGYQINAASGTPTTLILCNTTATTSTARIQLSPFYTVISGTNSYSFSKIVIFLLILILFERFRI
ncbi:unnamed protein product [Rotaria socialis]|uniref:Uncharacterized protein n=1 Tax=Rotaria socialis TaxID=392032 RepID=A0A817XR28_9BILA|nr:unnamed protein product [Rotaria socialis]CAF3641895.1 unnamed protein product [Rotaria socialis]CAF4462677.1 unnamed protein product [Rotaria socialis]CAF4720771.1 unnamed protein product [Rotaria socialis]